MTVQPCLHYNERPRKKQEEAKKMSLMRVISEAQFLAGEDARGALVVLEPETALWMRFWIAAPPGS